MGVVAALDPPVLRVEPGGLVTSTVTVRNTGSVVDEYTFEVVGEPAAWATIEPPVLRLLPGDEDLVTLAMQPPRASDAAAGELAFGLRVQSHEHPDTSIVEEGVLHVAPYVEIGAELLPRTGTGRSSVRYELAVDNHGNGPVTVDIEPTDPDLLLRFDVADPGLVIPPGQAVFTRVVARPVDRFLRGPNKTIPFTVMVASQDGTPPTRVDGVMVQQAILPPWTIKALVGLLLLAMLLFTLWRTVLRPTIDSAAQEAAEEAVEDPLAVQRELTDALADQQQSAQTAQQQSLEDITEQVNKIGAIVGEEPISVTPTTERVPLDARLAASAGVGDSSSASLTVEEDQSISLSDIVLQNPEGNRGDLLIRRDGEVLLLVALENFRDLDYHFVTPIVFAGGQSVVLEIRCDEVTAVDATSCSAAAYLLGERAVPLPPPPEPSPTPTAGTEDDAAATDG